MDPRQLRQEATAVHDAAAQDIARGPGTVAEKYAALVDLYGRQPNLSTRTSTSMRDQAYSTPAPLAFVASRLAGVAQADKVFEPTAGNGMLLIEAQDEKVRANELSPERARGAAIKRHPRWPEAKRGDTAAAAELVRDMMKPEVIEDIRRALGLRRAGRPAIVVAVHAREGSRNRIPEVYALRLADTLGFDVDADIVQTAAGRTGLGRGERITIRAAFDGPVKEGRDYLIVDDHTTSGGTIAELRAHIEAGGGKVVLVSTLSGNRNSAILAPSPETLAALRDKFPGL